MNVLLGETVQMAADTRKMTSGGRTLRPVPSPEGPWAPTVRDAADLIRATGGMGTVDRLDVVHTALVAAFEAGRRNPSSQ